MSEARETAWPRRAAAGLAIQLLVAAAALAPSPAAHACQFDTDCAVGSECIKPQGSIYGVCAGGMNPGNSYDDTPVTDPLDPNETVGDTCQFDTDCGPGNRCLKERGHINGVCVR